MKRPVLFYTPDRELYELSRGVHRSVRESAPGKVCDTFDELMEALENKDYEIEKIYQFVKDNFNNYNSSWQKKIKEKVYRHADEKEKSGSPLNVPYAGAYFCAGVCGRA